MHQLGCIEKVAIKTPYILVERQKAKKFPIGDVSVESDQRGEIACLERELEELKIREEYYLLTIDKAEKEL